MQTSCASPAAARSVEIFAGTARITKSMKEAGFDALGIDWAGGKAKPEAEVLLLDLCTEPGRKAMWSQLQRPGLFHVFLAPPCGTASRARERPIPAALRRKGAPEPRPLRSAEHPAGLPGLAGQDLARVQSANLLYELTARVVEHAASRGATFTVENPARSWFWAYPTLPTCWRSTRAR